MAQRQSRVTKAQSSIGANPQQWSEQQQSTRQRIPQRVTWVAQGNEPIKLTLPCMSLSPDKQCLVVGGENLCLLSVEQLLQERGQTGASSSQSLGSSSSGVVNIGFIANAKKVEDVAWCPCNIAKVLTASTRGEVTLLDTIVQRNSSGKLCVGQRLKAEPLTEASMKSGIQKISWQPYTDTKFALSLPGAGISLFDLRATRASIVNMIANFCPADTFGSIHHIQFSPHRDYLIGACGERGVYIFDIRKLTTNTTSLTVSGTAATSTIAASGIGVDSGAGLIAEYCAPKMVFIDFHPYYSNLLLASSNQKAGIITVLDMDQLNINSRGGGGGSQPRGSYCASPHSTVKREDPWLDIRTIVPAHRVLWRPCDGHTVANTIFASAALVSEPHIQLWDCRYRDCSVGYMKRPLLEKSVSSSANPTSTASSSHERGGVSPPLTPQTAQHAQSQRSSTPPPMTVLGAASKSAFASSGVSYSQYSVDCVRSFCWLSDREIVSCADDGLVTISDISMDNPCMWRSHNYLPTSSVSFDPFSDSVTVVREQPYLRTLFWGKGSNYFVANSNSVSTSSPNTTSPVYRDMETSSVSSKSIKDSVIVLDSAVSNKRQSVTSSSTCFVEAQQPQDVQASVTFVSPSGLGELSNQTRLSASADANCIIPATSAQQPKESKKLFDKVKNFFTATAKPKGEITGGVTSSPSTPRFNNTGGEFTPRGGELPKSPKIPANALPKSPSQGPTPLSGGPMPLLEGGSIGTAMMLTGGSFPAEEFSPIVSLNDFLEPPKTVQQALLAQKQQSLVGMASSSSNNLLQGNSNNSSLASAPQLVYNIAMLAKGSSEYANLVKKNLETLCFESLVPRKENKRGASCGPQKKLKNQVLGQLQRKRSCIPRGVRVLDDADLLNLPKTIMSDLASELDFGYMWSEEGRGEKYQQLKKIQQDQGSGTTKGSLRRHSNLLLEIINSSMFPSIFVSNEHVTHRVLSAKANIVNQGFAPSTAHDEDKIFEHQVLNDWIVNFIRANTTNNLHQNTTDGTSSGKCCSHAKMSALSYQQNWACVLTLYQSLIDVTLEMDLDFYVSLHWNCEKYKSAFFEIFQQGGEEEHHERKNNDYQHPSILMPLTKEAEDCSAKGKERMPASMRSCSHTNNKRVVFLETVLSLLPALVDAPAPSSSTSSETGNAFEGGIHNISPRSTVIREPPPLQSLSELQLFIAQQKQHRVFIMELVFLQLENFFCHVRDVQYQAMWILLVTKWVNSLSRLAWVESVLEMEVLNNAQMFHNLEGHSLMEVSSVLLQNSGGVQHNDEDDHENGVESPPETIVDSSGSVNLKTDMMSGVTIKKQTLPDQPGAGARMHYFLDQSKRASSKQHHQASLLTCVSREGHLLKTFGLGSPWHEHGQSTSFTSTQTALDDDDNVISALLQMQLSMYPTLQESLFSQNYFYRWIECLSAYAVMLDAMPNCCTVLREFQLLYPNTSKHHVMLGSCQVLNSSTSSLKSTTTNQAPSSCLESFPISREFFYQLCGWPLPKQFAVHCAKCGHQMSAPVMQQRARQSQYYTTTHTSAVGGTSSTSATIHETISSSGGGGTGGKQQIIEHSDSSNTTASTCSNATTTATQIITVVGGTTKPCSGATTTPSLGGMASTFGQCSPACDHLHHVCVICGGQLFSGEMYLWLRPCGHGGHVSHLSQWLEDHQHCPVCMTALS